MRFPNKGAWGALTLFAALGGSASLAQQAPVGVPSVPTPPDQAPPPDLPAASGPNATSQTEANAPRYDEVGYASWYGDELRGRRTASGDAFNPDAITAASRALPMGAFAEVTALDSGKTVLVEITDRGPHRADRLIDLSLGAAKLLGVDKTSIAAVRVRQVDPPAADQVALKQGLPASPRLDSPPVLLAGLKARLKGAPVPAPIAIPTAAAQASVAPAVPLPSKRRMVSVHGTSSPSLAAGPTAPPPTHLRTPTPTTSAPVNPPASKHKNTPAEPTAAPGGHYIVQVGTFSNAANARALAARIDGHAITSGKFTRVELGPFADSAAANRARDGVAKRGYGDAHVVRKD